MGWLLIGIVLLIIGFIIACKVGEENVIFIGLLGLIITLVAMLSIANGQVEKINGYQKMYHKYEILSEYVDNAERINENDMLYEEIIDYNNEIYKAKNEGFMTKWCHNPLYKELPYIEGTGIDLSKN